MQQQDALIPHLFRTEYRKIVSVLTKLFGFARIAVAEDIASDTFLTAAETWGMKGIPAAPVAWLYSVAKNKAKNYLQREALFDSKIAVALKSISQSEWEEPDFSSDHIADSQLQMMFAVGHPAVSAAAQVGLSLRILCGFGIDEIANAFLSSKETISKRLSRAKETLRKAKILIELPPESVMEARLAPVLRTIYLLFNEGYYSSSQNTPLRQELCLEAMRLCHALTENQRTDKPAVSALLALMCFHASRFAARIDAQGEPLLYDEQDVLLWDAELIAKGVAFLNRAACGDAISKYHLEAAIASWHTQRGNAPHKWEAILRLYNQLLELEYSPPAALNRAFACYKAHGAEAAIRETEKLALEDDTHYHTLLGELYAETDQEKAQAHLRKAASLARTTAERTILHRKLSMVPAF